MTEAYNNILSPIILSKSYANEEKINISATLKRDIFTIYQIKDGLSKNSYCEAITKYLQHNTSDNPYYTCKVPGQDCPKTGNINGVNQYVVIEFNNPSSIINVDNTPYTVKKITFHTPSYHYVDTDSTHNNSTYPSKSNVPPRETSSHNNKIIFNCLEIEILCEYHSKKLSVSILCNTNTNDTITQDNITTFSDDLDNTPRPFFGIIDNYIKSSSDNQLSSGGYKDTSRTLNIHDLLPIDKPFFKYNGSLFEMKDINGKDYMTNVTRVVFKEPIMVPHIFFTHIKNLTINSSSTCGDNNVKLNHFIDYKPDIHHLTFSDTNIDFTSKKHKAGKKGTDIIYFVVFIILIILIVIICIVWSWQNGIIQRMMRQIFTDNEFIMQVMDALNISR